MMTADEFLVGALILAGKPAEAEVLRQQLAARAEARAHTLAWVHASCEADMLPAWCIAHVMANVKNAMKDGEWPLKYDPLD